MRTQLQRWLEANGIWEDMNADQRNLAVHLTQVGVHECWDVAVILKSWVDGSIIGVIARGGTA